MFEQRVHVQAQHLVGTLSYYLFNTLYSYTYKYKLLREYKYIKLSNRYYVYGNEKDSAPKSVSSKGSGSSFQRRNFALKILDSSKQRRDLFLATHLSPFQRSTLLFG